MSKESNVIEMPQVNVNLTKQEVINLLNTRGFTKISQSEITPVPIKYWLRRFRRELITIAKEIEEVRISSITVIAEKDEKGQPKKDKNNQFIIPPDLISKFEIEFNALLKEKAEISFKKIIIKLADFPDKILSASDMNDLEDIAIFIDPEEKKEEVK